jgi:hypothetical protein
MIGCGKYIFLSGQGGFSAHSSHWTFLNFYKKIAHLETKIHKWISFEKYCEEKHFDTIWLGG